MAGNLPITMSESPIDPSTEVTVDDVVCCDCGGPVTLFALPDSVWDGLGYAPDAFACFECVGKRLNPELKAEDVRQWIKQELWKQRGKFDLEYRLYYETMKVEMPVVVAFCQSIGPKSVSKEAALSRTNPKE